MGKQHIYDHDSLYSFLRPYVDWICKRSYRNTEIYGRENIPGDGAVILAPNHCNTLMDALVILRSFKGATVFGARADMFKNPVVAKIMYFLRIIPMVRQRDGLRNVLKNHESTQVIVDTVTNGVRFCMFPEGRHRPARSVMPLGKGILRAAVAANEALAGEKPVYIVPAGLEYGDYFRYRSTSLLTYGKPINVTEFVKNLNVENEAQIMEPLRKELYERMSALITFFPDDDTLDAGWVLVKMLEAKGKRGGKLHERLARTRALAAKVKEAFSKKPEFAGKVAGFDKERRAAGLSIHSFGRKRMAGTAIIKGLASVALLPWFLFCTVVSLPMWAVFTFLKGRIKDKAFRNTAGFGVKLAMSPIMLIIWAVTGFCLFPWYIALPFVALTTVTYNSFYDCLEFFRRTSSDIRILFNSRLRNMYDNIINEYETL